MEYNKNRFEKPRYWAEEITKPLNWLSAEDRKAIDEYFAKRNALKITCSTCDGAVKRNLTKRTETANYYACACKSCGKTFQLIDHSSD